MIGHLVLPGWQRLLGRASKLRCPQSANCRSGFDLTPGNLSAVKLVGTWLPAVTCRLKHQCNSRRLRCVRGVEPTSLQLRLLGDGDLAAPASVDANRSTAGVHRRHSRHGSGYHAEFQQSRPVLKTSPYHSAGMISSPEHGVVRRCCSVRFKDSAVSWILFATLLRLRLYSAMNICILSHDCLFYLARLRAPRERSRAGTTNIRREAEKFCASIDLTRMMVDIAERPKQSELVYGGKT